MRSFAPAVAMLGIAFAAGAADELPVLKSTRPVVSVQEGETLRRDSWTLAPEAKPDVYECLVRDGRPTRIAFITDLGSLAFEVGEGQQYDFIIQHGSDRCWTRVVGLRYAPMAVFDTAYRQAHKGRISVEVPEVYELVNVAIALTDTGLADEYLVYQQSDYYEAMRKWFDPFKDHPAVKALETELSQGSWRYNSLKMNGYSFEFDSNGRIVQSRIYDRTGFGGEHSNALRPFIRLLQDFADAARFREFYRSHAGTFEAQKRFFTETAELEEIRSWLNGNFPGSKGYDSCKIIFSPLVAYNQSATWIEDDGFRELQAHVNFPYEEDVVRWTHEAKISATGVAVLRSAIVFTELNHGYINPEADRYAERIMRATSPRERWVEAGRGSGYYAGISLFNEYMNWGLVSLRVLDRVPEADQSVLIGAVERMMTGSRGFTRFAEFDSFLIGLYRGRPACQTIADLYPRIIEWFESVKANSD